MQTGFSSSILILKWGRGGVFSSPLAVLLIATLILMTIPALPIATKTAEAAGNVLVSNIGQSNANAPSIDSGITTRAQEFTTGNDSSAYSFDGVELHFSNAPGSATDIKVTIAEKGTDGFPTTTVHTLTAPSTLSDDSDLFFTAPDDDDTLAANTDYFVVVEYQSGDAFSVRHTTSEDEDAGAAPGWSISNAGSVRYVSGAWALISVGYNFEMAIIGPSTPHKSNKPDLTRSGNDITMDWTVPSDQPSNITEHQYRTSSDKGVSWDTGWTAIANSGTGEANATSITFSSLTITDGESYTYQIRAVNALGDGEGSDTNTVYTLPAAPADLVTTSVGASFIKLGWSHPGYDNMTANHTYQYKIGDDGDWTDASFSFSDPPYKDETETARDEDGRDIVSGLSSSTQYTINLRLVNSVGDGATGTLTATTLADPSPLGRPDLSQYTDIGFSFNDGVTSDNTPTITGAAEEGAVVTLTATSSDHDTVVATDDSVGNNNLCLLYTSPSPRDRTRSRMPSSA